MCYMATIQRGVGVRELRQNLSVYLRRVKAGEVLDVEERGIRVAVLAPAKNVGAAALDRLIAAGLATPAAGDLLDLGPPLGRRASRRASRALAKLREDDQSKSSISTPRHS
jgi:antitoxin (DNA-binding transcriptional repressor) of toxin-antitoxin stability system